jgi:hypothetical protein
MIDVSSSQFYGEGYDDSDKRIPDMTIINKQLGICFGGLGVFLPQPVADGLNMD